MKKIFFIVLLLTTVNFLLPAQVELDGVRIGDTLGKVYLKDTIQGINVAVVPASEDGIICGITVFPINEKGLKPIWSSQADMICVYFEEKYNITFNKNYTFTSPDAYTGVAEKDGIMYILEVQIANDPSDEYPADPNVFVWFNIINQNNVTAIEDRH